MQLIPYLSFDGQCNEAFAFYRQALGGEIVAQMRWDEAPASEPPMCEPMPPGTGDRIMHVQLEAAGATLMGADAPPGQIDATASQTCINVVVADAAEAARVFDALAAGGQVQMPLEETFWAHRFGMLVDRYGKPWMVNCLKPC